MKPKTIIFLIVSSLSILAHSGGAGTGGGDIRFANRDEIRKEILKYPDLGHNLHLQVSFINQTSVRNILEKWFDPKYNDMKSTNTFPIHKARSLTDVEIKEHGPCLHNNIPKASSVSVQKNLEPFFKMSTLDLFTYSEQNIGRRPIKLCYSLDLLEKKLQKNNVINGLRAITAHEYAHVFNADEYESQEIEDFYLINAHKLDDIYEILALRDQLQWYEMLIKDVREGLKKNLSNSAICALIGMSRDTSTHFKLIFSNPRGIDLDTVQKMLIYDIYRKHHAAFGFCGLDINIMARNLNSLTPINEGDRIGLDRIFEENLNTVQSIFKIIGVSYPDKSNDSLIFPK